MNREVHVRICGGRPVRFRPPTRRLAAAGRVVEGRRGGPLTDAASDYYRAAGELVGSLKKSARVSPRSDRTQ